jgi:hypothetical protein
LPSSPLRKILVLAKGEIVFALVAATCLWWNVAGVKAAGSDEIPFRKQTIDLGRSESVTVADINRDGRLDIVSGENWYEQAALDQTPLSRPRLHRWLYQGLKRRGHRC